MSSDFVDYYALLGVERSATEAMIKKAYKKKALELHPDKNPDNPKADELFMAVKTASNILTDPKSRADFDAKIASREAAAARNKEMDKKRSLLKEELEEREKAARLAAQSTKGMVSDIERLRQEGFRLREKFEQEQYNKRNLDSSSKDIDDIRLQHMIRLSWDSSLNLKYGTDSSISIDTLKHLFKLYGVIVDVYLLSSTNACVEFVDSTGVEGAVSVPPDGFVVTRGSARSSGDFVAGMKRPLSSFTSDESQDRFGSTEGGFTKQGRFDASGGRMERYIVHEGITYPLYHQFEELVLKEMDNFIRS